MATTEAVDIKKLLEAGAHFGHKTERWHPKMAQFIHSQRNGVHIINLEQTAGKLDEALAFLNKISSSGKQIIFVGTKRQAKELVKNAAVTCNMPYVTERWLGGMLTNWNTIGDRVKYLSDLENKMASGELANKYSKLEVQKYQEQIDQLNHLYSGIKELHKVPGAIVIMDVVHDSNAVKEARKIKIPIVGIVDTNADPSLIDFPIPANDDAIKSIQLILDLIVESVQSGKKNIKKEVPKEAAKEEAKVASK